jgi:hypothetical protein
MAKKLTMVNMDKDHRKLIFIILVICNHKVVEVYDHNVVFESIALTFEKRNS